MTNIKKLPAVLAASLIVLTSCQEGALYENGVYGTPNPLNETESDFSNINLSYQEGRLAHREYPEFFNSYPVSVNGTTIQLYLAKNMPLRSDLIHSLVTQINTLTVNDFDQPTIPNEIVVYWSSEGIAGGTFMNHDNTVATIELNSFIRQDSLQLVGVFADELANVFAYEQGDSIDENNFYYYYQTSYHDTLSEEERMLLVEEQFSRGSRVLYQSIFTSINNNRTAQQAWESYQSLYHDEGTGYELPMGYMPLAYLPNFDPVNVLSFDHPMARAFSEAVVKQLYGQLLPEIREG